MPTWQAQELERRQEEAMRLRHREAEEGKLGMLHPFFQDVAHTWMDFEHRLGMSKSNHPNLFLPVSRFEGSESNAILLDFPTNKLALKNTSLALSSWPKMT